MPETNTHQIIINDIEARLQTITVANGYYLELGAGVDVGRPGGLSQHADWLVDVIDTNEDPLQESQGINTKEDHRLHVDLLISRRSATGRVDGDLRKAIADVRKAFSEYRGLSLPANTVIVNWGGWEKPKSEMGSIIEGQVIAHLVVDYRTQSFNEGLT